MTVQFKFNFEFWRMGILKPSFKPLYSKNIGFEIIPKQITMHSNALRTVT